MKHRTTNSGLTALRRIGRAVGKPRTVVVALVAAGLGAIVFGGMTASAASTSSATQAWVKIQVAAAQHYSQYLYNRSIAYTNAHTAKPSVTAVDDNGTTLPHLGGSWSTGHVALGSKKLGAGTYLVAVTGDFYKVAKTDATPVLQIQVNGLPTQVTAYTGAFPANAAEGVGLSSTGSPNGLEQTASAYATVVIPAAGATAEVDAFGYNPDRSSNGSGDFGVIAHATFTKVG